MHRVYRGQTCNVNEVTEAVQARRAKVNLKHSLQVLFKLKLEKKLPNLPVLYSTLLYSIYVF